MSSNNQQDTEYAPAWRPAAGEQIAGEIGELSSHVDYNGDPYAVVTINAGPEKGEQAVHAFHAVLARELRKLRPEVGEKIAISYGGQKLAKDKRTKFHAYKVAMPDRPPRVLDWDKFGAPEVRDVERTGESDIPSDDEHKGVDDDADIPF